MEQANSANVKKAMHELDDNDKFQKDMREKAKGRQQFTHEGRVIYEWDQTIDEVNIYVLLPDFLMPKNKKSVQAQLQPGQSMPSLDVVIKPKHLQVGIKGNPPFLDEDLGDIVMTDECFWMIWERSRSFSEL